MSLDELFNKKPIILPGTASQRLRRQAQKVPVEPVNDKLYEKGCDYAVTYMKEEENLYRVYFHLESSDRLDENLLMNFFLVETR